MTRSEEEPQRTMQKLQATHQRRQKSSQREKGLIIVNAGLGKGKTTASLGMAFRAPGHGMKVGMVQFIKGNLPTGEQASVKMHSGQMDLHVVITGRYAPRELVELADLTTEMRVIKHPYSQGIQAQKGVECR